MMAICWDHWRPREWPRVFPFEVCLFFFLVMTGYLITGSLLRQRDRNEEKGEAWIGKAMKTYQIRRGLRILAPYYAALALAFALMCSDVLRAPLWYIFHVSNLHMATLDAWPPGVNHFWSLSMQQQFYLIWPFVIWFTPKRWLWVAMLAFTAVAPVTRVFHDFFAQWWARPEMITWGSLDYFGIGGLFALAVHRGMSLESPGLKILSIICFGIYVIIFGSHAMGWETYGLRSIQQTALSIGLCGFIATGFVGFRGRVGTMLETPVLQKIGQVSYGVYLYHNLAPILTGKIMPFFWTNDAFQTVPGYLLRTVVFAAVTWGLTLASWRWIEQPLNNVRSRVPAK